MIVGRTTILPHPGPLPPGEGWGENSPNGICAHGVPEPNGGGRSAGVLAGEFARRPAGRSCEQRDAAATRSRDGLRYTVQGEGESVSVQSAGVPVPPTDGGGNSGGSGTTGGSDPALRILSLASPGKAGLMPNGV